MKRTFKALLGLTALAVVPLTAAQPAKADLIQLGFLLNSSGSIGSGNWTTIKNGLASAIGSLVPTSGPNQYEISVVSFGSTTSTIVNHVLLTAANVGTVVSQIQGATFLNSSTNFSAAFTAIQSVMSAGVLSTANKSYVNFATDGQPNQGGSGNVTDNQAGINARNALITAGIDNISIEAIGSGVDSAYLQNSICYPQSCDTTVPYNFPGQGFYIPVANADAYVNAIRLKIQTVTETVPTDVPEPASMAVLGIGLLGLGMVTRRRGTPSV